MKKFLTTACLFVLTVVAIAWFMAPPVFGQMSARAKEEEAIRQVLARFEVAFEKRDARICTANFVDDADWEDGFGIRAQGRSNIEKSLAGVYQIPAQGHRQITELRIRFITSDVAVADVNAEILGRISATGRRNPLPVKFRTTHVFKKNNGNWRVVIFRSADLRDPRDIP